MRITKTERDKLYKELKRIAANDPYRQLAERLIKERVNDSELSDILYWSKRFKDIPPGVIASLLSTINRVRMERLLK